MQRTVNGTVNGNADSAMMNIVQQIHYPKKCQGKDAHLLTENTVQTLRLSKEAKPWYVVRTKSGVMLRSHMEAFGGRNGRRSAHKVFSASRTEEARRV